MISTAAPFALEQSAVILGLVDLLSPWPVALDRDSP